MSATIVSVSASAGPRPGCLTAISGPSTGNVAVVRVSKTAAGKKKKIFLVTQRADPFSKED